MEITGIMAVTLHIGGICNFTSHESPFRDPDKRRRRVTFCDDVIEHEPCCYRLHFSSVSAYVSSFFFHMKLKTVDVLLAVMRARRTENLKMTMKRSKVVQSMRRRKIMHWTSKMRVIELRKLVMAGSLVWTTSAL